MLVYRVLVFCATIVNCFGEEHDFQNDPYWFFDSKTAYSFVRGKDLNIPENCQIQQIFMLCRHGTRNASKEDNKDMLQLIPLKNVIKNSDKLKATDIRAIRNWKNEANDDTDKDLHDQGRKDMKKLSSSIKEAFGDIFKETFNPDIHKVLTSHEVRARQSGYHFLKNAFGNKIHITSIDDLPMFDEDDVTLNIDKLRTDRISKGDKKTGNVPKTEMTTFKKGPEMLATLERIGERIGLQSPIAFDQAKAMYESCRHDKASRIRSIPAWCRVFAKKDLQVFEYLNDMNWYYKFGWGNAEGIRLGCPLLTRLNLSFKQAANEEGARGVFYFGHRSNQFVAITMLGLARDDVPLKADNMEMMAERKWKTSHLNPFAANTIAAFYKCKDNVDRVSFFVNEKIMPIELDDNSTCTVCLWKNVEKKFDRITADKRECGFGRIITPP
ncbi:multiple inositol polyphosphate phosphatase 1-like isoform X2 [Adelges cooleyi]|uniref:multiple inositol polyphosphate phosphatase 1-like isoform X2 n=1 Tax=Adelges cooleyi TaxID=133065 RepID=UPI00217FCC37|nr:multiple inositol polyphosphate phosphatase 1-like isoform X2 [Adelges cooleyi]